MSFNPFTYLPSRPLVGAQAPSPRRSSLEDHFVTINLDGKCEESNVCHTPTPNNTKTLYDEWVKHCSSPRLGTDVYLANCLRTQYPNHSLVVTSDWQINVLDIEGLVWKKLDDVELMTRIKFIPPPRRNLPGKVVRSIKFGGFDVEWKEERFILYIAAYWAETGPTTYHFILKEGKDEQASLALIMASGYSNGTIGDSILVFNNGNWEQDYGLWEEVQKADWKDVILSADFKQQIQSDTKNFFASETIYHELAIPWKRGVIFLGPPGNGKTISIKALIKSTEHPALYVKSFKSWAGEEFSIKEVFGRARREAPCLLILEDLDALINDENRSFFLNELDGLENNDGLFILGTTNHFERLDPGLSDRPSRFDRKYTFELPNRDERVQYAQYWQRKLKNNKDVSFPDSLVEKLADLSSGFSFAYLKEAFVSTLVSLAGSHSGESFEKILLKQIADLRKQVGDKYVIE